MVRLRSRECGMSEPGGGNGSSDSLAVAFIEEQKGWLKSCFQVLRRPRVRAWEVWCLSIPAACHPLCLM